MSRCLLFVYGLLKSNYRPPRTTSACWPDQMAGQLFDLGPYPAAVAVGIGPSHFDGEVLEIDDAELAELDAFEHVADGLYRRRQAATVGGRAVWVYEYARPLPAEARQITRWPS